MPLKMMLSLKSKKLYIIIFIAVIFLIAVAYNVYKHQRQKVIIQSYNEIEAIADLKSSQITYWYNKLLMESTHLSTSANLPQEIKMWIESKQWDTLHFINHVGLAISNGDYSNICVTDNRGSIVYSYKNNFQKNNVLSQYILNTINEKTRMVTDFYRNPVNPEELLIDIIVPILLEDEVIATVVFSIDLNAFYIPVITAWPTEDTTAEIILVKAHADSIKIIKYPRTSGTKPLFKIVSRALDIPVAYAVAGKTGMYRGKDYYGYMVLTDLSKVESTPWHMVIKVGEDAILKKFNTAATLNIITLVLIIIVAIGTVLSMRHKREKRFLLNYQNQLNKAKEKAEQSDLLKTVFLANLSHEIRTPMNGIMGFLNLLSDNETDEELKQEYLALMKESSQRLLDTLNDIIEISRIEVGETIVKNSMVNINEVINYHYNFFKLQTNQKNIKLVIGSRLDSGKSNVFADKHKINGIFTNLLRNAIKFTEAGVIEFGAMIENNQLIIYFKDTGIGIPITKKEIIFERFAQADNKLTRKYEGSGLGLSIVKAYIEAMHGTIDLYSEVNKGSLFKVSIPLIEAPVMSEEHA